MEFAAVRPGGYPVFETVETTMKQNVRARADRRLVEACQRHNVDIDSASPEALVRAYCRDVLKDPQWANVILDVARSAGYRITG